MRNDNFVRIITFSNAMPTKPLTYRVVLECGHEAENITRAEILRKMIECKQCRWQPAKPKFKDK